MGKQYDALVIGPVSLDINVDYQENEEREVGGAVVQSSYAAARSGAKTAIFTKLNPADADPEGAFAGSGADVFWKASAKTTSIHNKYFTADKERRDCRALGQCDPFSFDELPEVESEIYHFAGLMVGDFSAELIRQAAAKGKVAVDVQCLLRTVMPDGTMQLLDYAEKKDVFPFITYLKTDAAEAEILTGLSDRFEAAKALHALGAKEVMVSHNTEMLVYDGAEFYTCPVKARSLVGRSGRGDTTFAGYLVERLHADAKTALQYATALVSLKMETPGPFKGERQQVLDYITAFYSA